MIVNTPDDRGVLFVKTFGLTQFDNTKKMVVFLDEK